MWKLMKKIHLKQNENYQQLLLFLNSMLYSVLKGNILGYYPIIFSVCCVNTHAMWRGLCFTKLQTQGISGVTEIIFLSIASIT